MNPQLMSLQDLVLVNAVDLLRSRWELDAEAATSTVQAIARQTGAELGDVAALVVAAHYRPLKAVHL